MHTELSCSLQCMINTGFTYVDELPQSMTIDNTDLIIFLAIHWAIISIRFPQIKTSLPDIQYQNISNINKAYLLLSAMLGATERISISFFVENVNFALKLEEQIL